MLRFTSRIQRCSRCVLVRYLNARWSPINFPTTLKLDKRVHGCNQSVFDDALTCSGTQLSCVMMKVYNSWSGANVICVQVVFSCVQGGHTSSTEEAGGTRSAFVRHAHWLWICLTAFAGCATSYISGYVNTHRVRAFCSSASCRRLASGGVQIHRFLHSNMPAFPFTHAQT